MGLFDDTIRDARRPLRGGWVRRMVSDAADSGPPEEDFAQEVPASGMQTVFRFQKVESPASPPGRFREASLRPGVARHLPGADPLSAGAAAERPKPNAIHVGNTDISVRGDNQESSLETGQEANLSPSKVEEAASVKSNLHEAQSVVLSAHLEVERYRATPQSETPEGSEPLVNSGPGETFLRRPPGRGALSETFPSQPPAQPPSAGRSALAHDMQAGRREATTGGDNPDQSEIPGGGGPLVNSRPGETFLRRPPGRQEATASTAPPPIPASPGLDGDLNESKPARAARESLVNTEAELSPPRRSARPDFATPRFAVNPPEPPSLVIGRIEVVVVAHEPSAQPTQQHTARADRAFLSRNYLKRL